jgi:NAD(P)-dependent dehydrogenase (short-subunit alcohol dehydrogenase family)
VSTSAGSEGEHDGGPIMADRYERQQEERPAQEQERQPGIEAEMEPRPEALAPGYRGSGKLDGRVALITGGDSGIGRAVAVLYAREGADVAIVYLDEHEDAEETKRLIEGEGRRAVTMAGDVGEEAFCREAVERAVDALGGLDILVNHAGEQHEQKRFEDIGAEQLERTFRTNVFGIFHITKAALAHLPEGGAIVNTTSVTAYQGNPSLIDYSATNGAISALTYSLSQSLIDRGIRVNAVAPGPVWTPLIPASFPAEKVEDFGTQTPLGRIGQPEEIAPSYVFLASDDASFISGQVVHPNGGTVIRG